MSSMRWTLFCLAASFDPIFASNLFRQSSPIAQSTAENQVTASPYAIRNAPEIFNAIHSSMRQWGSSLNHNGMSFFHATIPEGTELYHGSGKNMPVKGIEWLAFEPEHALNFAWNFTFSQGLNSKESKRKESLKEMEQSTKSLMKLARRELQGPLVINEDESSSQTLELLPGFLHTYQTSRPLQLLYIDGMSAAEPSLGCADSQEAILNLHMPSSRERGMMEDAEWLCGDLSRNRWHGAIDGFIRMEHGFEIVMCNFSRSVGEPIFMERVSDEAYEDGLRGKMRWQALGFWKAVTARYNGIGNQGFGPRATLNFDYMVTAWNYEDAKALEEQNRGIPPEVGEIEMIPRLEKLSREKKEQMFNDLDMLMQTLPASTFSTSSANTIDYQAVADMIVLRYSDYIQSFAFSSRFTNKASLDRETTFVIRPFLDYDNRNSSLEVERCTAHFINPTIASATSIAAVAVKEVSRLVCQGFADAIAAQTFEESRAIYQGLMERLKWTSWKSCNGCGYDEICYTAIWPWGKAEDHLHPTCRGIGYLASNASYWGWEWA